MNSISKRLEAISRMGYIMSLCYGACPCETHQGRVGWSVQLHEQDSTPATEVFAARSLEHCVEIAEKESSLKRGTSIQ